MKTPLDLDPENARFTPGALGDYQPISGPLEGDGWQPPSLIASMKARRSAALEELGKLDGELLWPNTEAM